MEGARRKKRGRTSPANGRRNGNEASLGGPQYLLAADEMDTEPARRGAAAGRGVRVCPDCGSPAGTQPFCASCGRNLSMIERLPTRAEWERDGASALAALPEEAIPPTKVAAALASIRTWSVPLDRSRSFQDSAVRDRLKLSVEDHVAAAIELDAHEELPIDIAYLSKTTRPPISLRLCRCLVRRRSSSGSPRRSSEQEDRRKSVLSDPPTSWALTARSSHRSPHT